MQFKPTIWDTANGGNPIKPLGKGDTLSFLTPDPVVKTAAFSALANYSYSLNPSGGGFNIALPTIADNGAMLMFADTNGSAATQHIVLKQGTTTIAIINSAYGVAYLSFNTALAKWSVITLSVPYPAMSNYESVYVNPTYGDDITGTGLINNPFKTVQSAIDSFTAGSPHVIYVLGSTTEDISFRSNDQSMRIVLDAKSEHSGTITFVDGNTSIYFDCPNGDATISGVINDDSSGNIYFNGYVKGIYNKTGGNYSSLPGVICDPYEEGEPLAVKWSGEVTPTSVANFNPASVLARAGAEVPGDPNGDEGYVLQFTNSGVRVKVKFDEYVRLHRILTNVSARTLWSLLVENKPVDDVLDKVPDEFYNWVRDTVAELKTNFKALFGQVTQSYDVLYEEIRGTTDRERRANFANLVKNNKYKGLMFSLYDGKDISEKVWLMVKPEHAVPFKKDEDDV